jgi:hypothetical protein
VAQTTTVVVKASYYSIFGRSDNPLDIYIVS